ncbi:MAG: sulfatase family protein [Candidatus Eiseniibacteriota bacterium]
MSVRRGPLVALVLGAALGCSPPPSRHPDVLLITVDTLRPDRLGSFGQSLPTSPSVDRLAAEGVLFTDCTVQWPKTWPSMASLVTGAHPRTTGMRHQQRKLPPGLVVLGEVFGDAGYQTAAVVANFNVGRELGFDQGFDHFVESWQERWQKEQGDVAYRNRPGRVKEYTDARTVTDQGLAWLGRRDPKRPFFLWLHYMDPHGPYVPPSPWSGMLRGDRPARELDLEKIPEYQRQDRPGGEGTVTDLGFYVAQYEREVLYFDDELGRLRAGLEGLGLFEGAVIVLSADHGESFDEHEYYLEHGRFAYQPTANVPLIFRAPSIAAGRRIVPEPVGLVDVSGTLLELAGLRIPETFEGVSLAGMLRGEPGAPFPSHVFVESGYVRDSTQIGVRRGPWKLLQVRAAEDRAAMKGAAFELYDLRTDPGESVNVAAQHPEVVAELSQALRVWYEEGPSAVVPGEEVDLDALPPEAVEMLEALGYTGQ